ncbi:MAG: helix-turn-helix domain-containing protein [Caulobacterales bacterium]
MAAPTLILDMFVRGMACGVMALLVLAIWRSAIDRDARIATLLFGAGTMAWLVSESRPLWGALGDAYAILLLAYPMGGFFWLFILSVFADRPIGWRTLLPAAILFVSGVATTLAPQAWIVWVSIPRDLFSVLLILHAGLVVVRGWSDDMVEGRRRLRSVVLGAAVLFGGGELIITLRSRVDLLGDWLPFTVGQVWGATALGVLALCIGGLFLRASPALFGPARRPDTVSDPRLDAADRLELDRLDAAMASGVWRREGLTIGALAEEVSVPEHRLRRLINQRMGHRNFADFLNVRRVEAAKQRLSDPREARTTVAVIAFELGYGSLGPFNRAFRAATNASPTEWRRRALGAPAAPDLQEAV